MSRPLRVLWTHNSDPAKPTSLVNTQPSAAALQRLGVDVRLEYLGNLRSVRGLWRARRHVARIARDFDIVHAQYGSACGLATAAADVPRVLSVRGNDWNVHSEASAFYYMHTRLARAMTRLSLGRYDRVICMSRRMAAELAERVPAARVRTLPSPLDVERFVPHDRAAARAALGFPGNRERWILFTAVSLNDPVKRFPLAQRAFDLANARLGGTLRLRVATQLPHDALPLFAAACDLILCTSETEGWPNCVKEALACNVPFVSTDVSDLADIARLEPTCRVCAPTPEALAEGIHQALAAAAPAPPDLRRYVSGMRLDLIGEQLLSIYRELTPQVH